MAGSNAKEALKSEPLDDAFYEQGVEEIVAEHGGDARKAIRALLQQISYLELARNRAINLVSFGSTRGKLQ